MFASGMDYGREGGGAGTILTPTRWTEHWPMTPVEGCPTVFQTICSLPPGYHQYKFIVDGKWRHDEHQPFVTGNYGVVNTILLSREPYFTPAALTLHTTSNPSMDVDNEVFQHVVRVTDGTSHDTLARIS
ncbi:hypothetical protein L2E82_40068 [Cichorium intybus]|uniref:Uncharacterized protein n=1 Tax=Cichorium intybus TaxID=13427 RepID=A0ACB9APC8_CICIN|nr:hypothetical protein L2E82_40068 [Cichorium intybus]